LVSNFIPTYAPAVFFRFHMLTYLLYLVIVSIQETFTYSGYTVMPTSFLLAGTARRNDMHLLTDGEGNFGPWGIMDWLCKTNVEDADFADDGRDEAEELEQRAKQIYQATKRKAVPSTAAQATAAPRQKGNGGRRR
jgi:sterol desaturase/sphingolipid hydroxylase (fatty acid hydroxylase superfamily)